LQVLRQSRNLVCRRSIFKLKSLLSEAKIEGCNLVCRFCGKAAILFAGAVFSSSKASFSEAKSRAAILFAGFATKAAILFASFAAKAAILFAGAVFFRNLFECFCGESSEVHSALCEGQGAVQAGDRRRV
jgi:hypothetical protein